MKPWLARTLLGSAIALALLAGLWLLLDSRWSGEVERLRARPSAGIDELLPPIDPAQDAGPIYVEVGRRWGNWKRIRYAAQTAGPQSKGLQVLSVQSLPSQDQGALVPDPASFEAPEFTQLRELMHAAAGKSHCRLWNRENNSFEPWGLSGSADFASQLLLHAAQADDAQGAWTSFESALALAAHLREDPLIVSLLASRSIASRSLGMLPRLLARNPPGAVQAQHLLASVQRLHPEQDALRAFDGERVLFAEPAWDSIREGRFPSGIWMRTYLVDSLKLKALRPWRLLDEAKYFEIQEATRARIATDPWREPPSEGVSDVFPITQILSSGLRRLTGAWILEERHARDLAEIALRLAIARAESGSYPSTLDALGDLPREPITDEPYAYARVGEGYTLSSWSIPR